MDMFEVGQIFHFFGGEYSYVCCRIFQVLVENIFIFGGEYLYFWWRIFSFLVENNPFTFWLQVEVVENIPFTRVSRGNRVKKKMQFKVFLFPSACLFFCVFPARFFVAYFLHV